MAKKWCVKTKRTWRFVHGKVKIRFIFVAVALIIAGTVRPQGDSSAEKCPDVRFVFARGSGGERWTDQNYLAFKSSIEEKMAGVPLRYEFFDLDYPAIGISDISVITGAFFGAGESYEFGRSVDDGVMKLAEMINHDKCARTKYVLGGYSQGAMVISKALHSLNAGKVIYAATFGDPKLFLPEGKSWFAVGFGSNSGKNFMRTGTIPAACKNENLSEYRKYVPDCYAYEGLLGSYQPYQPATFAGKLGTWCNKTDVFCSSYFSVSSHVSYVSDGLYEDASRVIIRKIAEYFGTDIDYVAPHNTVIMLDSSASMTSMIGKYKIEALRLARETLKGGGKVALYDYKDYSDGEYHFLTKHCDFSTCTEEVIEQELNLIRARNYNNPDWEESVLAASWRVMKELNWENGATKSFVILTDAGYHSPDKDDTSYEDVVRLSREIDPVNFYIVTSNTTAALYENFAHETGGKVAVLGQEEVELTDYIMERYDALPVVELDDEPRALPDVTISDVRDDGEKVTVLFKNTGTRVMVALNDLVVGTVEGNEFTVDGLDRSVSNEVRLVALSETRRGWSDSITLGTMDGNARDEVLPLAPNTGKL